MDVVAEQHKRVAAEAAAAEVVSGMVVGLGTGSTARYAIERLGALVRAGTLARLVCIPTSEDTARRAREAGLSLSNLEAHPQLDLAMDGADEVDPNLDLIKGMGGAMLREKRVARASQRFVVFVDEGKRVRALGERAPVPVEVTPHSLAPVLKWLETLGARAVARGKGGDFRTDNGNAIVDCHFAGGIPDPHAFARALDTEPRVLAHGLFLGMASEVLVGGEHGVERIVRSRSGRA